MNRSRGTSVVAVVALMLVVVGSLLLSACTTEVTKEVIKEVPKEVIKEVPKEVIKEVPKEVVKEVREETLKVGLALSLSGPSSDDTSRVARGMLSYLKYMNEEQGGVAYKDPKSGNSGKVKFNYNWEDNAFDTPRTVDIYKRMKDAGVNILAIQGGGPTAAVAAAASKDRLPVYGNALATPAILDVKPMFAVPSFPPAYVPVRAFLVWVKDNWKESRPPVIGLMNVDAVWGKPASDGLKEFADKIGVKLLPVEVLPMVVTDSSVEMKRLADQKPDWVFVHHTDAAFTAIKKDAIRLGVNNQIKWGLIGFAFLPEKLAKALPAEAVDGLVSPAYGSAFDPEVPTLKLLGTLMPKYWGEAMSNSNVQGWLSMQLFGEGIRLALNKVGFAGLTPEGIRDGWLSLDKFDTGGTAGIVSTSPQNPYFTNTVIFQIKGGKVVKVADWYVPKVD